MPTIGNVDHFLIADHPLEGGPITKSQRISVV